jgi:hypothetical protein
MTIEYVLLGTKTQTTARLWCKSDADGALTCVVNGALFTGDTSATATHDGCGAVDITGLALGTQYTAELTVGGSSKSITFKTSGEFNVGWASSCNRDNVRDLVLIKARQEYSFDYAILLGDTPYNSTDGDFFGITTVSTSDSHANATNQASAYGQHERMLRKGMVKMDGVAESTVKIKDDHEYLNNFCLDAPYTRDNTSGAPSWYAPLNDTDVQTQQDSAIAVQQLACASYSLGNKDHFADDIDYYYFDSGAQRFIVLDGTRYKVNPTTGIFLGDTQLAWFKAALSSAAAAGIDFITLMSSKATTHGNGDGWHDYRQAGRDELAEVWEYIEDNSISSVAWLVGDKHHPFVQYNVNPRSIGSPTAFSPHLCICGGPLSTSMQDPPNNSDVVYSIYPDANGEKANDSCIAIWETSAGRIDYKIFHQRRGTIWHGYQLAGSNAMHYPEIAIAV